MKTILVLIDFSKTATHAAKYGCMAAKQLGYDTIVLYHSQQVPLPASELAAVAIADEESQYTSLQCLHGLQTELKETGPKNIRVRTDTMGLNSINTIAEEEEAALIIMGTVGKTKLQELFLGSNAIKVCEWSDYPVILVPVDVVIEPVRRIIFACDMKNIRETIPVNHLKKILECFNVPLTVVNVDADDKHFTPDTPEETMALHDLLKDYNPEYYNIVNKDVANGILEFVKANPASLVLLISRQHNFIEGLFYRSLTKQLAHKSPFPLLVIHEQEHKTRVLA